MPLSAEHAKCHRRDKAAASTCVSARVSQTALRDAGVQSFSDEHAGDILTKRNTAWTLLCPVEGAERVTCTLAVARGPAPWAPLLTGAGPPVCTLRQ